MSLIPSTIAVDLLGSPWKAALTLVASIAALIAAIYLKRWIRKIKQKAAHQEDTRLSQEQGSELQDENEDLNDQINNVRSSSGERENL